MQPVARVELGVPSDRRSVVAFPRAGEPPSTGLLLICTVANVDNHVELVVLLVARLEVGRACGEVGIVAVDPPENVAATRVGATRVEKAYASGFLYVANVVDAHPRPGQPRLLRLVGHEHHVVHDGQGVGAQVGEVQVRLDDDPGIGDVCNVHPRDVLGRALMGHVQNSAARPVLVEVDPLANVAEAVEQVVGDEPHVANFLRLRSHSASFRAS